MKELELLRKGDWMQTYTKTKFYPIDPLSKEVDIVDIAHSLSLQCRFAGHCKWHYSVARHSLYVSQFCTHKLEGLLHDASEAYLIDFPRPVKHFSKLGDVYKELEEKVNTAIADKFSLIYPWPEDVLKADEDILWYEHREVMGVDSRMEWYHKGGPIKGVGVHLGIGYTEPAVVEDIFLNTFFKLILDRKEKHGRASSTD